MGLEKIKIKLFKKFQILIYLSGLKHPIKNIKTSFKINKSFKNYNRSDETIEIKNIKVFKKSFIKFSWAQSKDRDLPFLFLNAIITKDIEKFEANSIPKDSPILICPVKDDLDRVKVSLEYYRGMGIKYFVYIDNLSNDGTFEFLKDQPDVNLYICKTPYTTLNREAWINRILSYYGFDRWYICVDSDELFVYENMEEINIEDYVKKQDIVKHRRIKSILLDMYSQYPIFNKDIPQNEFRSYYCYFDANTYKQVCTYKLDLIMGGPRQRKFFKNSNGNNSTKYPLFFFKKGDIQCCSHFQFPYKPNCDQQCKTALLHYKFLYSDLEKYVERVKLGNYSNGSKEYKSYLEVYEKNNDIVLYDSKHSIKFINSSSLKEIKSIYNE